MPCVLSNYPAARYAVVPDSDQASMTADAPTEPILMDVPNRTYGAIPAVQRAAVTKRLRLGGQANMDSLGIRAQMGPYLHPNAGFS